MLSKSKKIHQLDRKKTSLSTPLGTRKMDLRHLLSLSLSLTISLVGSVSAQPSGRPIYLRYQGALEGSIEDLSNTIDCTFELLDEQSDTLFYERQRTITVLDRKFTVTLGQGSSDSPPLTPQLFLGPTSLFVKCDLNNNGNHEVVKTEPIGPTPLAAVAMGVSGFVEASSIEVNGDEVVNPDGEWIGEVATTGEVNAAGLVVDSARVNGQTETELLQVNTEMTAAEARISALEINQLTHSTGNGAESVPLIDESGTWLGPIEFVDSDQDGAKDVVELLAGTDPLSPTSAPVDENQDDIFDIFQLSTHDTETSGDLPFDPETFTNRFVATLSATEFTTEQTAGEIWPVTSVSFNQVGIIESLEISIGLNHSSGVHHVALYLDAPNGDRFQLVDQVAEPLDPSVTTVTYRLSADEPSPYFDWSSLVNDASGTGRALNGAWSLLAVNASGDAVSPTVSEFSLTAHYRSTERVTITRDIDLTETARLTGIQSPVEASDAVNKAYVDDLKTYPNKFTYRYQTIETFDPNSGSYFFLEYPELFGGVSSESWSISQVSAAQLNLQDLNSILNKEATAGTNALIANQKFTESDDRQGLFLLVHAQVENTTQEEISWPLQMQLSCRNTQANGSHQISTIALNGQEVYTSQAEQCTTLSITTTSNLTLPPAQVSDIIFAIASSEPNLSNVRRLMFALTSNSLDLPEGLVYRRTW